VRKLTKPYVLWIRAKQQYYKWYWFVFPPKKKSKGFYGWQETGVHVLDTKAVGVGLLMKEDL